MYKFLVLYYIFLSCNILDNNKREPHQKEFKKVLHSKNTHVIIKVQQERNTSKKNLKKVLTRYKPHDILKVTKTHSTLKTE